MLVNDSHVLPTLHKHILLSCMSIDTECFGIQFFMELFSNINWKYNFQKLQIIYLYIYLKKKKIILKDKKNLNQLVYVEAHSTEQEYMAFLFRVQTQNISINIP